MSDNLICELALKVVSACMSMCAFLCLHIKFGGFLKPGDLRREWDGSRRDKMCNPAVIF